MYNLLITHVLKVRNFKDFRNCNLLLKLFELRDLSVNLNMCFKVKVF